MKDVKIREIIEKHQHWLRKDCDKWKDMRANLCGADLRGAHLWRVNLSGANLCGADLNGVDLREANLCGVDLREANLCGANLHKVNLYRADLYRADLRGVDLREANLCRAILYRTNLYRANLSEVDLREANLHGADLRNSCLWKANLCEANLQGAYNIPFIPYACPDFGAFTGFKKARGLIVVLEIPEDARRSSATGRKCRCDKAKVVDIQNIDGTKANVNSIPSNRDNNFIYKIGEEVRVLDFDENRWNECSTGIHFFINRQEAVDYI